MYILGISAYYHDSAAVLLHNSNIIAAVQEERFTRKKHDAGFPKESIKYCLKEGDIDINLINHIAINSNPKAHALKKIIYTLKNRPDPKFIIDRINNTIYYYIL